VEVSGFIQCRDLFRSFGEKAVLRGVNLTIEQGETMVILGGSGTGKSVLLKHMNGLIDPDSGEVFVDGLEISQLGEDELREVRKKVAMVFQGSALFDSLTVAENVAYPLYEHAGGFGGERRTLSRRDEWRDEKTGGSRPCVGLKT
jgi:phospholipid/cholesterol/gamma-HCH transport system ATP-binding protein